MTAAQAAAHKAARTLPAVMAQELIDGLGSTLTAAITQCRARNMPGMWAKGTKPNDASYRRLSDAYRVWLMVSEYDGPAIARNWLIGANPWLNEEAPAIRLYQGDVEAVVAAANAFITDQGGA